MLILDPRDLVWRSFLLKKKDGKSLRERIVKSLDDYDGDLARHSSRMKFFCSIKDNTIEVIFTYNDLLDHINNSEEDDLIEWKFKDVTAH